jgi:hypothetical protein
MMVLSRSVREQGNYKAHRFTEHDAAVAVLEQVEHLCRFVQMAYNTCVVGKPPRLT